MPHLLWLRVLLGVWTAADAADAPQKEPPAAPSSSLSDLATAGLEEARIAIADDPPPDEVEARIQELQAAVDKARSTASNDEALRLLDELVAVLEARRDVLDRVRWIRREISEGVDGEKSVTERLAESKALIASAQADAEKLRNQLPEGAVDEEALSLRLERTARMKEEIAERENAARIHCAELEALVRVLGQRRTDRQEAAAALEAVPPPGDAAAPLDDPAVARRRLAEQKATLTARRYREILWLMHKMKLELEVLETGLQAARIRMDGAEAERLRYQIIWDARNTILKSKDLAESLQAERDRVEKLRKDLPAVPTEEQVLAVLRLELTERLLETAKLLSETTASITEVIDYSPAGSGAVESTADSAGKDAESGAAEPQPSREGTQVEQAPAMVLDAEAYVEAWKTHASSAERTAGEVAAQHALVMGEIAKLRALEGRVGKRPDELRARYVAARTAIDAALAALRSRLAEMESKLDGEVYKTYFNNLLSLEVRYREYRKLFEEANEELRTRLQDARKREAAFQQLAAHLASLGKKSLLIRARRDLTWASLSGVATDAMEFLTKVVGFLTFRDDTNLGTFIVGESRWRRSVSLLGSILLSIVIALLLYRYIDRAISRLMPRFDARRAGPATGRGSASATGSTGD